jgi:hypothetical protein
MMVRIIGCAVVLVVAGCPGPGELCGLPTTPIGDDEVGSGQGKGTRSDGDELQGTSSWRPAPQANVVVGTLSFDGFSRDEVGSDVFELIANGAFPICVRLGERNEDTGNATLPPAFVTSSTQTGVMVLTDNRDGVLGGRFDVSFAGLTVSDGVFRATQRDGQ